MAKSNPIGVRFDLEMLEAMKEDDKIKLRKQLIEMIQL